MCQGIAGVGRILILDSGFCVLAGLTELKKMGVYASAVIKKWRYWPKYIPGNDIDQHMSSKDVGAQEVSCGTLDGVPYNVFCMKEPDYVMKLMLTYGDLLIPNGQEGSTRIVEKNGQVENFSFTMSYVFANHFWGRHMIDNQNNQRHSVTSIEGSWITHH